MNTAVLLPPPQRLQRHIEVIVPTPTPPQAPRPTAHRSIPRYALLAVTLTAAAWGTWKVVTVGSAAAPGLGIQTNLRADYEWHGYYRTAPRL